MRRSRSYRGPVASLGAMDAGVANSLCVFGSLWTSGRAATLGLNPYAAYDTTWMFQPRRLQHRRPQPQPTPAAAAACKIFASVDVVSAARCLIAVSTITYIADCGESCLRSFPLRVTRIQILWLFAAPAFQDTLALGPDLRPPLLPGCDGMALPDARVGRSPRLSSWDMPLGAQAVRC